MRRPKPQITFEKVSLSDVPFWSPKAEPPIEARGSKWDDALAILKNSPGFAIVVKEPDKTKRDDLKSTLQTIAKNRLVNVKVREVADRIFAWRSEDEGRLGRPKSS